MTGKALMAEGSITKLESVIAGIRGYIGEQLSELENELGSTRGAVTSLGEQLAARETAIAALEASRELLLAKLNELDGAEAETHAFAHARESREEAGDAVAETIVAAAGGDAVVGALPTGGAKKSSATGTAKLTDSQASVLGFLNSNSGVHKVSEIAVAVQGGESDNAGLQAIRRALAVLTEAGLALKSTQSGTAFYSANTDAPAAAKKAPGKKAATPKAAKPAKAAPAAKPAPAAKSVAAAKPAAAAKAASDKAEGSKPEKAVDKASAAVKAPVRKAVKAVKAVKAAKKAAPAAAETAPAEKTVRADRTKIVAALLAASEPQSAGDVSRTVMGSDWRASDATNFRNVLKNMVTEGVIAEHIGENNRARYTVAATS